MDSLLQNFDDVWTLSLLLAACVALPSGIIQGYAGFGGALFAVPLFAILFGPVAAFCIVVILMLVGQIQVFSKVVKIADWKEVAPIAGPSIITLSLGITFLVAADPAFIQRGMGVFILLITVFLMYGYRYTGRRRALVGVATGSVAGGITGSFGVPAFPLSALYFHSSASAPDIIRANVLTALLCNLIVGIIGLTLQGAYTEAIVMRAILVYPIFTVGIYVGQYLFRIAPADWFKKVTYAVLIVTALILLAK
jgi:uncharacterized membrane protein YfcA